MKIFLRLFLRVLFSTALTGCCILLIVILYTNAKLPSVSNLEDIQLQVPLRIYTRDGKLIGEFGETRRNPIRIHEVPEKLKLAILATEDRRFYEHHGVDLRGLARAGVHLITRGNKDQGASTITMQVARNFYLTRKKTFARKLNEILLAIKIEKELSKDQILELYLNKIYFGKRAYGVQAAAYVYYGMPVSKLNLAQMAMLAGLPQAPSAINPLNNPEAALKRRTHVLNRMKHYGFITEHEYKKAMKQPIHAQYHGPKVEVHAPYVAEMARQWLVDKYGSKIYTDGFEVYTTVDTRLQKKAQDAMQSGLLAYDKRHGYRGPAGHVKLPKQVKNANWQALLAPYLEFSHLLPAVVTHIEDHKLVAYLSNGQAIDVYFKHMTWARPQHKFYLGSTPKTVSDVAKKGDIIYVESINKEWSLSQVPVVSGALVSLNPKNGAIISLVGGFDFRISSFNRANQAYRQCGSNFKPFIYSTALDRGFTAASIINDAPLVFHDSALDEVWRPQNDTRKFYGPTRLRVGLTKSRNLVTIRLLQAIGLPAAREALRKFGFERNRLPDGLSLALGTINATPLEIATGYAGFANGGYKVSPFIVEKVIDPSDKVIYKADTSEVCTWCDEITLDDAPTHPSIMTPQAAYIMDSILKDAIQTGTGQLAKKLNRHDIAGKTGTTNQQMDAWYSGYNPDIVTTVWVGFDEPKSLQEYAAQAALPIWVDFMGYALKNKPEKTLPEPPGIVTVRIDPNTGLLASPGATNAIFEVFKEENVPTRSASTMAQERESVTLTPNNNSDETLF
ncbi:MAG TPA: penicillin-binding protein 1A [Gammaproteobacteria bacterium]|nr:penicillin-binding protein 1A [Gammaproteobacteria bacterium]